MDREQRREEVVGGRLEGAALLLLLLLRWRCGGRRRWCVGVAVGVVRFWSGAVALGGGWRLDQRAQGFARQL